MAATKPAKPKTLWKVAKGNLTPADSYTIRLMRERGFKVGDLLAAVITKPRNPKFHSAAHQMAILLADNTDAFHGVEPHTVLKRLQIEGDIGCDNIPLIMPNVGPVSYRVPRSLSFESMDEGDFQIVMAQLVEYVAGKYWKDFSLDLLEKQEQAA